MKLVSSQKIYMKLILQAKIFVHNKKTLFTRGDNND